jgi:hypothetical protein
MLLTAVFLGGTVAILLFGEQSTVNLEIELHTEPAEMKE